MKPGLVKPETALFLEKSHELLERADTMMGVDLTDDAGRAAYLAGLHAAQAFIFETTGRVFKRHSGVQREFSRLVKDDPRVDAACGRSFPALTNSKPLPIISPVPVRTCRQRPREAIQTARQLVECVAGLLPPNGPTAAATPEPDPSR